MTLPQVVGLGSHHGDDQAGWLVIDCLCESGYPAHLLRKALHPADLLDDFSGDDPFLICDACKTGCPAGTVHRWIWPIDDLTGFPGQGTHDLPLTAVLELARQFQRDSPPVEVWGIAGADWSPTSPPSLTVQAAAREVATAIRSRHHA